MKVEIKIIIHAGHCNVDLKCEYLPLGIAYINGQLLEWGNDEVFSDGIITEILEKLGHEVSIEKIYK
jgi:hypothetical protein